MLDLHRRHAGLVRAIVYWLGADLEVIDGAVLRVFVLAGVHARSSGEPPTRISLARAAWRVTADPTFAGSHGEPTPVPGLALGADLLARFLARHTTTAAERAAFVLAEFAGVSVTDLAVELGFAAEAVRRHLAALREAMLHDPEVIALGGPRAVLTAALAPFLADQTWRDRHAHRLAAQLSPATASGLSAMLRRPATIVGLGFAAVLLLLLLRPAPPAPAAPRPAPVVVAVARPAPAVVPPPLPLPVPTDMSPAPAPVRKVARRGARRPSPAREALAAREKLAQARDPGAIIVELEMIGAGRKSLPADPRRALAYADAHARDYPDSQLVVQRSELRVRALCALGRPAEARSEAQRRPHAKVQDALRDACKP